MKETTCSPSSTSSSPTSASLPSDWDATERAAFESLSEDFGESYARYFIAAQKQLAQVIDKKADLFKDAELEHGRTSNFWKGVKNDPAVTDRQYVLLAQGIGLGGQVTRSEHTVTITVFTD